MDEWITMIALIALALLVSVLIKEVRNLRLRLRVMESLLNLHHSQFPYVRDLLICHHAHLEPEEREEEFIWPVTNESM